MKIVKYYEFGNEDVLKVEETADPVANAGELLVEIKAVAVNPGDVTLRSGTWGAFPIALPHTPGAEASGTVLTDGVRFKAGDRVIVSGDMMGFTRPGLSAEKVAVGEHLLVPVPSNLSFEEAAVIPASYLTSYLALTQAAQVQAGDTLLVTGATGAAGSAAVQIAKTLGAEVFAVTRSEKDVKDLIDFGADHVIDVSQENLTEAVKKLTDGKGVKTVLEFVGGETFSEALAAIAPGGKLISIGYVGGRTTTIPIFGLLLTGAIIQGFSLFAFPPQIIGAAYQEILQGFAEGKLKVNIERKFSLDEVSEAHRHVAQRSGVGRFVLAL